MSMWEYTFHEQDEFYLDNYFFEEEYKIDIEFNSDNPVRIFIDDYFGTKGSIESKRWTPTGRRPYYQMRGKPVEPSQAMDIISQLEYTTSNLLSSLESGSYTHYNGDYRKFPKLTKPEYKSLSNLVKKKYLKELSYCDLFCTHWLDNNYGWIRPSGKICINNILWKYPEIIEIIEDTTPLVHHFPYLDFIIAITGWNEVSPSKWEEINKRTFYTSEQYNNLELKGYSDEEFCNAIEIGVHVHNNKIEFLNPEDTIKVYKEYSNKYEEKGKNIYSTIYGSVYGFDKQRDGFNLTSLKDDIINGYYSLGLNFN